MQIIVIIILCLLLYCTWKFESMSFTLWGIYCATILIFQMLDNNLVLRGIIVAYSKYREDVQRPGCVRVAKCGMG